MKRIKNLLYLPFFLAIVLGLVCCGQETEELEIEPPIAEESQTVEEPLPQMPETPPSKPAKVKVQFEPYGVFDLYKSITSGVNDELIGTYAFAIEHTYNPDETSDMYFIASRIVAQKISGESVEIPISEQVIGNELWFSNGRLYYCSFRSAQTYSEPYYFVEIDLADDKYRSRQFIFGNDDDKQSIHRFIGADDDYMYFTFMDAWTSGGGFLKYYMDDGEVTLISEVDSFIRDFTLDYYSCTLYYILDGYDGEAFVYSIDLISNESTKLMSIEYYGSPYADTNPWFFGNTLLWNSESGLQSYCLSTKQTNTLINSNISAKESILFLGDFVYYYAKDSVSGAQRIVKDDGITTKTIYNPKVSNGAVNDVFFALSANGFGKIEVTECAGFSGVRGFAIDTDGNYLTGDTYKSDIFVLLYEIS